MHDRFLTRLGKIYHFFTTEYMTKVFDEMIKEIEPEMQLYFSHWAEENDKAISFDNPTTPEGALRYWYQRLDRTRNVLKNGQPTFMKWCKNNLRFQMSKWLYTSVRNLLCQQTQLPIVLKE